MIRTRSILSCPEAYLLAVYASPGKRYRAQPRATTGNTDSSIASYFPAQDCEFPAREVDSLPIRAWVFRACFVLISSALLGQGLPAWNFTIGGGVGFPQGTSAQFVNNGANFVVGGGPNFRKWLRVDAEFMWHDLPIKKNILQDLQVPGGGARTYSVTINAMVPIPTPGKIGLYAIGGGGWYYRSGELTRPGFVPGEVCPPFYVWWVGCETGFFPGNVVLASSSTSAWGGNIGGGITYSLGMGPLKLYTEVRYHHVPHTQVATDLLPITFGLRW